MALFILPFIFAGCDMGVKNGDDLIGKWMNPYNYYCEYITFHEDNTGYYELRNSDREMTAEDFVLNGLFV